MTTPAHCTRTWPAVSVCAAYDTGTHRCAALDSYHHVQHVCDCGNVDVAARCTRTDPHMRHNVYDDAGMWLEVCPGVEPPADVTATPDPRLDYDPRRMVLAKVLQDHIPPLTGMGAAEIAQYGLYALDDFAAAQAMDGPTPCTTAGQQIACPWRWAYNEHIGAPAGLTPAQEIRMRLAVAAVSVGWDAQEPDEYWQETAVIRDKWAGWVEHGDDETPSLRDQRDLYAKLAEANADAARAHQRADLAEARLGHIADALRDVKGGVIGMDDFVDLSAECLTWTPDDTATAGAATGDGDG